MIINENGHGNPTPKPEKETPAKKPEAKPVAKKAPVKKGE